MTAALHVRSTDVLSTIFEWSPLPQASLIVPGTVRDGDLIIGVIRIGGSDAETLASDPDWTVLANSTSTTSRTYIVGRVANGREGAGVSFDFVSTTSRFAISAAYLIRHWSGSLDDVSVAIQDGAQPPAVNPSWTEDTLWLTGVTGRTGRWTIDGNGPAGYDLATRESGVAGYVDEINPDTDDAALVIQHRLAGDGSEEAPGAWVLDIDAGTTLADVAPHAFTIGVRGDGHDVPGAAGEFPQLVDFATYEASTAALEHSVPLTSVVPRVANAGDLILVIARIGTGENTEGNILTPSGFTVLGGAPGFDLTSRMWVFGRIATLAGSDDSVTLFTDPGEIARRISVVALRYSRWEGSLRGIDIETAMGDANPPSLTPYWGRSDQVTWLAGLSGRTSNWAVDSIPTGFSDLKEVGNVSSELISRVRVASCGRELEAASIDPVAFTTTGVGAPETPQTMTVAILGRTAPGPAIALLPALLSSPTARAAKQSPRIVPASTQYFARLVPPVGESLDLSISSWQGTRQLDRADFLQVVIPAPTQAAVEQIVALLAAGSELVVYQKSQTTQGAVEQVEMLRVDAEQHYLNAGPFRDTLTLSGYKRGTEYSPLVSWLPVSGIRTSMTASTGVSVRCTIDRNMLPGMEARLPDGSVVPVSYINYYVGTGTAWMQIGERT